MDYDQTEIAAPYDRSRALAPETARLWLNLLSTYIGQTDTSSLVVDLGCGTGRFSDLIALAFGVEVIGVEPSEKMIDQARRKDAKGKVSYRRGSAEALSLPDACADLIFMSNVYHHLSNPAAVVAECHRVLQPSGHVCVRNGTREDDFPHRHFFPGLEALIGSELPSQDDIRRVLVAGGFATVVHQTVKQVIAPNWSSFVFDILVALIERPGETITKEELITWAWPATVVEEAALRVHVAALRKALGDGRADTRYTANHPGRGYAFIAPVTRENTPQAPVASTPTAEGGSLPTPL